MIAGATAVQVGTANFADPFIWTKLMRGIEAYVERHHVERLSNLIGSLQLSDGAHA